MLGYLLSVCTCFLSYGDQHQSHEKKRVCQPHPALLVFGRDENFLSWGPPMTEAVPCVLPVTLIGVDRGRDDVVWAPHPPTPTVGNLSFYLFAHSIHSETIVGIVLSILNMIRPCQETQVLEPPKDLSCIHGQDVSSPSSQMNGSISQ